MLRKVILVFFLFGFILLSFCKKKVNTKLQFNDVCQKVVQCDKNLKQFGDVQKHCENLLVGIEKNAPDSLKLIVECIQKTNCEELSLLSCTEPYIRELQIKKPGMNP